MELFFCFFFFSHEFAPFLLKAIRFRVPPKSMTNHLPSAAGSANRGRRSRELRPKVARTAAAGRQHWWDNVISRCSRLVYTIYVGINQFNIALPHSFAPTTVFHQSRSPLRSFFKTAVGTK